jgi:hypothetical protein
MPRLTSEWPWYRPLVIVAAMVALLALYAVLFWLVAWR